MNIYQKLAEARQKLKDAGLKQSGKNKGVGYTYFDLSDILPHTTKLEKELGLLSVVSFSDDEGILTIYNSEDASEKIVFASPLRGAELRGCHPVQNLGAAETYVRRYLYLLAYEIDETESLDMQQESGKPQSARSKTVQAVEAAVEEERRKKQELSKARKIQELITGTAIQAEEITNWIKNNLGVTKKVNDLTDEEFNKLYSALERAIREDVA